MVNKMVSIKKLSARVPSPTFKHEVQFYEANLRH
jgi:hypothetical protein